MRYGREGRNHYEGIALGNGKLGAVVLGGEKKEQITLNQDSLWSGRADREKPQIESRRNLSKVRRLLKEGKIHEAQELADEKLLGYWTESYMPMGTLYVAFEQGEKTEGYSRELALETGTVTVEYRAGGIGYRRTCFVSKPDGVLVLHLKAEKERALCFTLRADSLLRHTVRTAGNCLIMEGQCPDHVEPNYVTDVPEPVVYEAQPKGMRFAVTVGLCADASARVTAEEGCLRVVGATECTITAASENSFEAEDYLTAAAERLKKAAQQPYETLYRRHREDFSALYQRSVLELGQAPNLPMEERLRRFREGYRDDTALYADYYNYGRYLLISAGRQGVPANLQGIWSWELQPAWSANWTTNINVQMNYWPAEVCGLSELHLPLVDWLLKLSESGEKTASALYGCRGYCVHHNVDIWGMTTPAAGDSQWALWPMAGVWLAAHAWQHYLYTNDRAYLEEKAYGLLEGSAAFCCDWLLEDEEGVLITAPSTSPENGFYDEQGRRENLCCGCAMDMTLIRELFWAYLSACEILDRRGALYAEVKEKQARLAPVRLTADGRIAEWREDYPEVDKGHRHLSPLYGVYPGNSFDGDARLWEAAKKTLAERAENGSGTVGWSAAWSAALFARFGDKDQAIRFLDTLIGYSAPNLFDIYNDSKAPFVASETYVMRGETPEIGWFQIDGNFGGTAAIASFLLQAADRTVTLLPCLPDRWKRGSITGLCAPGDVRFSIKWEENSPIYAEMTTGSRFDPERPLTVRCGELEKTGYYQKEQTYTFIM